jgi:flagellar motor switch protein FliG
VTALASSPDAAARGVSALCAAGKSREAAAALVALGPETASELFKRLRIDEVETLTFEIARLDTVGAEDLASALSSLASCAQGSAALASGGIDYAREVLEKALGSQGAIDVINRLTESLQARPFDCVRQADPVLICDLIQAEHPQTIALVLSFLDPDKAATALSRLPPSVQGDVIERVASLGRVSCEAIREVERVLEKKLSAAGEGESLLAGGPEAVVEMLNLVDRATEKGLVEFLEENAPSVAEEVKKRMFVFEDIVLLDDRSIQKTLREVDGQEVAKALKPVGREVREKFFRNMSQRAAMMLKEDMELMGPLRLSDAEAAQQGIVAAIRKLEESGEIVIARGGDELIV